ncbi:MAG TPA: alkyl sulfatase dimerization domain-containing protein, partial [Micromonosporaceae bacterium]
GVRAVYQKYLGFYDGNPAHLNPHSPVDAGTRYVAAMGGPDKVLAAGQAAFAAGDYRWTAELVNHLVFAYPTNAAAVGLQADALEQLGYQSENGTWRSLYLTGAYELRNGVFTGLDVNSASPDTIRAMSPDLYFDYLGIRLNGDKAAHLTEIRMNWNFTDLDQTYALTLRNAALTYRAGVRHDQPHTTVTLTKQTLDEISMGRSTFPQAIADRTIAVDGDTRKLTQVLTMVDDFDLMFNIVTP